MEQDRIEEICKESEERYNRLMNSIINVEDFTLDNLPKDRLKDFKSGRLYEFLPYRKELGGRIIFECAMEGERVYFDERHRIYDKESFYGIEKRENPAYIDGINKAFYSRIPEDSCVLDIGCGAAKYLKTVNNSKGTILAMDMSREVIEENKKVKGLDNIHFFPGNCLDLSYIKDAELDYITGVNILNVISPKDVVKILSQGFRTARRGMLFGFTLPAKSDFWTDIPPDLAEKIEQGANDPDAPLEYKVMASNQSFLGQMNLFAFVRDLCRQWNWKVRVFRFLDRHLLDEDVFFKTDDSNYIGYGNNAILKVIEYPSRIAANIKDVPEGNFLIHAVGYGIEIYFLSVEELPGFISKKEEGLYYFEDNWDFHKTGVIDEMNRSINYWNLPFY